MVLLIGEGHSSHAILDYAIATTVPLTLANYLIVGWFLSDVDQFYLTSWKIFVGMAVVFNILVFSIWTLSYLTQINTRTVSSCFCNASTPTGRKGLLLVYHQDD
jgi:hypothetical protein